MSRRRLSVLVAAVILASCGVPRDPSARRLDPEDVPFGLASPASTTTVPAQRGSAVFSIFLIREEHLVRVERRSTTLPDAATRLAALVEGPHPREASSGLRTTVDEESELRVRAVEDGVATVDLGEQPPVSGPDQILAIAQVVVTLAEDPTIDGVRFTLGGEPVAVPAGDGTLRADPLRPVDFLALLGLESTNAP